MLKDTCGVGTALPLDSLAQVLEFDNLERDLLRQARRLSSIILSISRNLSREHHTTCPSAENSLVEAARGVLLYPILNHGIRSQLIQLSLT
jgi:hypothetical protein